MFITQQVDDRIRIGDSIIVTVVRIQGDRVRIGVEAPARIAIHREEVYRRAHGDIEAGTTTPRNFALAPESVERV
jgi:carbon storage regulator